MTKPPNTVTPMNTINSSAADHDLEHLSPEELSLLRSLHQRGWAVCLFAPWELDGAAPDRVCDAMAEAGWRQIEWENVCDEMAEAGWRRIE